MKPGHVYLVGAGPGDPELLTVKAWRTIRQAEVIVYDRLANRAVLELAPGGCALICAGKRKHLHAMTQEHIHDTLIEHARHGSRVVRLKGGDPFIFARGGEEIEALAAAGVPWHVIPGITAASGAAASLGVPLTHRDVSQAVTLITAHRKDGKLDVDWELMLHARQTVVVYMGLSVVHELVAGLRARGLDEATRVSIVARATHPDEEVIHANLADVDRHPRLDCLDSPALIIVHNMPDVRIAATGGMRALRAAPR